MLLKVTARVDLTCISKLRDKLSNIQIDHELHMRYMKFFQLKNLKIENEINEFSVILIFKDTEKYRA